MTHHTKQSDITTDHEIIRKWVEEREGKPARVQGTGDRESAGVLRIDFPGGDKDNLDPIGWDDFFQTFEENELAFLYQEKTEEGGISRFNKFVDRNSL